MDEKVWYLKDLVTARTCWLQAQKDKNHAKGKYLEALLCAGLAARGQYTTTPPRRNRNTLLAGEALWSSCKDSTDAPVEWGCVKMEAQKFPCEPEVDSKVPAWIRSGDTGILVPSDRYNMGCDVIVLGRIREGDVSKPALIAFECRYWEQNPNSRFKHNIQEKAVHFLIGLLANYRGCFRRVMFVYFTTDIAPTLTSLEDSEDVVLNEHLTTDLMKLVQGAGVTGFRTITEVVEFRDWKLYKKDKSQLKVPVPKKKNGRPNTFEKHGKHFCEVEYKTVSLSTVKTWLSKLDPECHMTIHAVRCPDKFDPSAEFRACMMETLPYLCPSFELK